MKATGKQNMKRKSAPNSNIISTILLSTYPLGNVPYLPAHSIYAIEEVKKEDIRQLLQTLRYSSVNMESLS
jgi:hypothetical protein